MSKNKKGSFSYETLCSTRELRQRPGQCCSVAVSLLIRNLNVFAFYGSVV